MKRTLLLLVLIGGIIPSAASSQHLVTDLPDMSSARILGDVAVSRPGNRSTGDQAALPDTGWVWYRPRQCLGYQDNAGQVWVQILAQSGITHRTNIVEVGQMLMSICQHGSNYIIFNVGQGGGLNWTGLAIEPAAK